MDTFQGSITITVAPDHNSRSSSRANYYYGRDKEGAFLPCTDGELCFVASEDYSYNNGSSNMPVVFSTANLLSSSAKVTLLGVAVHTASIKPFTMLVHGRIRVKLHNRLDAHAGDLLYWYFPKPIKVPVSKPIYAHITNEKTDIQGVDFYGVLGTALKNSSGGDLEIDCVI